MPEIGNRVEVTSWKAAPRVGTVVAIDDRLITVRWDSGEQTSLIPGPGVLNVIAKGPGRKPASKKATPTKKTQPLNSSTPSPSSKTKGSGSTVSVKRQAGAANKKATTKAAQRRVTAKTPSNASPRPAADSRARQ